MIENFEFRVWDKKHKCMVRAGIGIGYCNFDIDLSGKITREVLGKNYCGIDRTTTESQDNYVFQQYVGIKDKNGKKIYEGDKLRCAGGLFQSKQSLFSNQEMIAEGIVTFYKGAFTCGNYPLFDYNEFEVIGNMFESPTG